MRATEPSTGTDERALLLGWLAFHRDALETKCAGLTGGQLTTRSVSPSRLTLLGLVRHMTEMERAYLSQCLTGQPYDSLYCPDDDPDGDSRPSTRAGPTPTSSAGGGNVASPMTPLRNSTRSVQPRRGAGPCVG